MINKIYYDKYPEEIEFRMFLSKTVFSEELMQPCLFSCLVGSVLLLDLVGEEDIKGITAVRDDMNRVAEALYAALAGDSLDQAVGKSPGFTVGNVLKNLDRSCKAARLVTDRVLANDAVKARPDTPMMRKVVDVTYESLNTMIPAIQRQLDLLQRRQRARDN